MAAHRKARAGLVDQRKLFRFKTFSESLSAVRIDVVHKVDNVQYVPESLQHDFMSIIVQLDKNAMVEHFQSNLSVLQPKTSHVFTCINMPSLDNAFKLLSKSYFNDGLAKWRELNCSEDFVLFNKEVSPLCQSLHQLIHHKVEIIGLFKTYLAKNNSLAAEPLLDLLVQLARDIQGDFYPHFSELFAILTPLLKCKNATLIEQVFQCLAYLMKFLWRTLVQDIQNVFSLYTELLESSQPKHIRQFAAESFAYLVRKVHNVSALADVIFEVVDENNELTEGIGLLLFETCKGVQKHLHSNTAKVVSVLLSKLGPVQLAEQVKQSAIQCSKVFDCLKVMMRSLAEYTRREYSAVIWTTLTSAAFKVLGEWSKDKDESVSHQLQYILHLIGIWVSWKSGSLLVNAENLVALHYALWQEDGYPHDLQNVLFQLLASFLLVPNAVTLSDAQKLVQQIFHQRHQPDLLLGFTKQLFNWKYFSQVLMPEVPAYLESCISTSDISNNTVLLYGVTLVLELTDKWRLDGNSGADIRGADIHLTPPQSPHSNSSLVDFLCTVIADFTQKLAVSVSLPDIQICWCAVVCATCCTLSKDIRRQFDVLVTSLVGHVLGMAEDDDSGLSSHMLFLLGHVFNSLTYISQGALKSVGLDNVLMLIRKHTSNVYILSGVFKLLKTSPGLCGDLLHDVLPVVKRNITSPFPQVRLVTLEILCLLDQYCTTDETTAHGGEVLTTCLEVEKTETNLQNSKKKLMYLERLKYRSVAFKRIPDHYKEIPLMYLCSMFYINFSPLWAGVTEIIASYAVNDCKVVFWNVFGTILDQSSKAAEKNPHPSPKPEPEIPPVAEHCGDLHSYYYAHSEWENDSGRTDYINFRYLLWKVMEKVPEFVEQRSRTVVPIFMDFMKREFTPWEDTFVDYQSICSSHESSCDVSNGGVDTPNLKTEDTESMDMSAPEDVLNNESDLDEEISTEALTKADEKESGHDNVGNCEPVKRRNSLKTLKQMLSVFCLFKNPKGLYQQKELLLVYNSLLMQRDPSVQQLALKCIATFKQSSVTPYFDNLASLLDDVEFNTELLKFSSSSEQYIVSSDHAPGLIPVLVRILYGRMLKHGQAKATVHRRGVILRFLETCGLSELQELIDLILAPFIRNKALEQPDPHCVVPLRKQQGFLKLCVQMVVALKQDIVPYLSDLLEISLKLTKHSSVLLDMRKVVGPQYISSLRNIRQLGIQVLIQIFDTFPNFGFADVEETLFQSAVWPQLEKLPHESIQNPTPLLKLLHQWSCYKQHHLYFLKLVPDTGLPVMHFVYSCLFSKQVHFKVTNMVLQITTNLLQEMHAEDSPGYLAVYPHMNTILNYISQRLSSTSGKKKVLLSELNILSKISPVITDSDTIVKLVNIILPIVSRGSPLLDNKQSYISEGHSSEVEMLRAVKHLVGRTPQPCEYLRQVGRLFLTLSSRYSRQELCEILQQIAKVCSHLEVVAVTVSNLNAWHPTHIDEPDYITRVEAFDKCPSLLNCEQNFEEVVLLLVNNAMFFLLTTSDLSIRDSAAGFISKLINHDRIKPEGQHANFVIQLLFHGILRGLKSQNEMGYHEVLAVIGQLVKSHREHPRLKELVILSDPDPEADFFENVRHIQVHRRTRAFLKLKALISKETFRTSTLFDIFLPMVSHVISSPVVKKEHNLLSAAVDVLSAITSRLNWSRYKHTLMKYLKLMTKQPAMQKILLKVVLAILNAFHFNLDNKDSSLLADKSEDTTTGDIEEETGEDVTQVTDVHGLVPQSIQDSIVHAILPELQAKMVVREEHSDVEVLRAPLVLAMINLLQSLPEESLHSHLPGILLKICTQLKSRAKETRDMARDTLVKLAQSLGPSYVPYIVKDMKETLTKGYQIHVLAYSIHALLNGLSQHLNPGDLDPCLEDFCTIVTNDLFGTPSEERDTPEAVKKLPEAKTTKGYESLELMVSKLSPKVVPHVIESLLKILKGHPTAKVANQVSEALRRVTLGILDNKGFSVEHILVLVHGLLSDSVPEMTKKPMMSDPESSLVQRKPSILLPPEPKRGGPKPVTQHNVTAHIVTNFGLQLTVTTLRKHKLQSSTELEMVDPFIQLLLTTIKSKYTNILSATLKCLRELLSYPLPAMDSHLSDFVQELFSILGKYAKHGAAIGPNQELVGTAFRTMTAIINTSEKVELSEDQLQLLLTFVEEDIHDPQRQSTAFPLLKAIIARKLSVSEIHDVMERIIQLSIVSDSESVKSQCRHVICQFLLDYPLGKKIYKYLATIVSNLNYDEQSGRESVLELCNYIFAKFPPRLLRKQATFFFVPLSSQLVNDASPVCREMAAMAIKKLFSRLDGSKRSELADFVSLWFKARKLLHRQIAVHVLGLFVEVEMEAFSKRLAHFLPLLLRCLDVIDNDTGTGNDDGFVGDDEGGDGNPENKGLEKEIKELDGDSEDDTPGRNVSNDTDIQGRTVFCDHLLFTTLSCFGKVLLSCHSVFGDPSFKDVLDCLWNKAEEFLLHPHIWVRLSACKLFGLLFAAYPPTEVAVSADTIPCRYLTSDPLTRDLSRQSSSDLYIGQQVKSKTAAILYLELWEIVDSNVSSLSNKFYRVLKVRPIHPEIGDQVVKNLVFCARVIHHHQCVTAADDADHLRILMMKMDKLARLESGNHPKESSKRLCVYKWVGALAVNFDPKTAENYLDLLLKPIYRELSQEQKVADTDCYKVAEEVADVIGKVFGRDTVARVHANIQKELSSIKERRKRKLDIDAVVNPEITARRKIRKNIRKKIQRKAKTRRRF